MKSYCFCLSILLLCILMICAIGLSSSRAEAAQDQAQIVTLTPEPPPVEQTDDTGIPEGYMIIEGDIIVPVDFYQDGNGPQGAWDTKFWPNGTIPFNFNANVTEYSRTLAIAAMAEWEAVANVDFVSRTDQANYIHIQHNPDENSSFVGMIGGKQVINIASWPWRFIIAHELGHALGLWHEQSRLDRDSYVNIIRACIPDDLEHNFNIQNAAVYPKGGYKAFGLAGDSIYDFDSVMHYDQAAFYDGTLAGCTGSVTIDVLPPYEAWQSRIGQRNHLSTLDKLTMSFLYPASNWRFVDSLHTGSASGTFIQPHLTFLNGVNATPSGGTLWVQPGSYNETGTFSKPITIRAPLGYVTIGN